MANNNISVELTDSFKEFIISHYTNVVCTPNSKYKADDMPAFIESIINKYISEAFNRPVEDGWGHETESPNYRYWFSIGLKKLNKESGQRSKSGSEHTIPYINQVLKDSGRHPMWFSHLEPEEIGNYGNGNKFSGKVSKIGFNEEHFKINTLSDKLSGLSAEEIGDIEMNRPTDNYEIWDSLFKFEDNDDDYQMIREITDFEINGIHKSLQAKEAFFEELKSGNRRNKKWKYELVPVDRIQVVGYIKFITDKIEETKSNNAKTGNNKSIETNEKNLKTAREILTIIDMMYILTNKHFIPLRPKKSRFGRIVYFRRFSIQNIDKGVRKAILGGVDHYEYDINACAFAYYLTQIFHIEKYVKVENNGKNIANIAYDKALYETLTRYQHRTDIIKNAKTEDEFVDVLIDNDESGKFFKDKLVKYFNEENDIHISNTVPALYKLVTDKHAFREQLESTIIKENINHINELDNFDQKLYLNQISSFVKQAITAIGFGASTTRKRYYDLETGRMVKSSLVIMKNATFNPHKNKKCNGNNWDIDIFLNDPLILQLSKDLDYVQCRILKAYELKHPDYRTNELFLIQSKDNIHQNDTSIKRKGFYQQKLFAYLYQSYESKMMQKLYKEIDKSHDSDFGSDIIAKIHDGFVSKKGKSAIADPFLEQYIDLSELDYYGAAEEFYDNVRDKSFVNEYIQTTKNYFKLEQSEKELNNYKPYYQTDDLYEDRIRDTQDRTNIEYAMHLADTEEEREELKRELNKPIGILNQNTVRSSFIRTSADVYTSRRQQEQNATLQLVANLAKVDHGMSAAEAFIAYNQAKNEMFEDFEDDSDYEAWV